MGLFGSPNIQKLKNKIDISGLIKLFDHQDYLIRVEAAEALAELSDVRALDALIQTMQDESKQVRRAVAEALGNLGDLRAVEPLKNALINNIHYDVRMAAAEALGNIGHERAVDALNKALRDKNKTVRQAAANALERIASKSEAGREKLSRSGNKITNQEKQVIHKKKLSLETLISGLKSDRPDVRKKAISSLGKRQDPKSFKPLIQMLKDKNEFVRGEAAKALGKIKDKQFVDPLIKALIDRNEFVRGEAVKSLGKIGEISALEPLILSLADKKQYVVDCTVLSLKKFGARVIPYLLRHLKGGSLALRIAVARVLENLGWEPANDGERIFFLVAKGELKDTGEWGEKEIPELIQVLKDKDPKMRKNAARILGRIKDNRAIEPLMEALNDIDTFVIGEAAKSLGKIGDKRAVDSLILFLEKDIKVAKTETIKALGKIRDKRAVEPLLRILNDENGYLKKESEKALIRIQRGKTSIIGVRKCHFCEIKIERNQGFLFQGTIPDWAKDWEGQVPNITDKIGITCEHSEGQHPFALWYWCCNECGSHVISRNTGKIIKNGAPQFWDTGKPPLFSE
jgi:HEAT repeat protein